MKRIIESTALLGLLVTVGCEQASTDTLIARAGERELTVAKAVEILGPRTELPNQPQVVASLAELWIDYTLLAEAALADTTFADIDVTELVDQQAQAEMVLALQEEVIQPDTIFEDGELEGLFQSQAPGIRVSARHILMGFPPQATSVQRDSVTQAMAALLERIRGGEDFATLAQSFSQDRGSGAQGGNLGEFGAGEMVRPFEEAAFALEPGEVSGLVETPFGLHIIRVDEKSVPTFEESRLEFRAQVLARRYQEAESIYIAGLRESGAPRAADGAAELVKELAQSGTVGQLSPRAANRELATFEGGAVTVAEFLAFLATRPPQTREAIATAPVETLESDLLMGLAQRELLILEAEERGLGPSPARRDSLATQARESFAQAGRMMGFFALNVLAEEQGVEDPVAAAVEARLLEIVSNQREVLPLGPVGFTLRQDARTELFEAGIIDAVNRIEEIRGPQQEGAPAPAVPGDTAAADSATVAGL